MGDGRRPRSFPFGDLFERSEYTAIEPALASSRCCFQIRDCLRPPASAPDRAVRKVSQLRETDGVSLPGSWKTKWNRKEDPLEVLRGKIAETFPRKARMADENNRSVLVWSLEIRPLEIRPLEIRPFESPWTHG